MDVDAVLSAMKRKAQEDPDLCRELLDTKKAADPLSSFCAVCRRCGYELYPMELLDAGESMYAAMKRSTNGGGENSPLLDGQDDLYGLFLSSLSSSVQ